MKAVGNEIKNVLAIAPVAIAESGANTGLVIDRLGFLSAVFAYSIGAVGAAISSGVLTAYVQHGASSTLSDAAYASGAITTISAATCILAGNQVAEISVDLTSLERYIRLYSTHSFTWGGSGTTPSAVIGAVAQLGQASTKPV